MVSNDFYQDCVELRNETMSKKTSIHKTMKSKKRKELSPKQEIDNEKGAGTDENPLGFGGLPDRDLKKNLGCG